ncbi:taste receptor type 2 member 4-like [Sorex fumeus]|uniref:taste receptor type 2 member 4-like n=1 Tax=Sorex fumeus TaxID=62283 RepID=UPI0024AE0BFB|nr:taste receptor type 2 member 4-like [Sorex fumeus]
MSLLSLGEIKKDISLLNVGTYLFISVFLLPWASVLQLLNSSMRQDDSYFIFSAIIVTTTFDLVGLTANLFIAVFSCKNWMRSQRIVSSDKILFSLGIVRVLVMGLFLLNTFGFFIFPDLFRSVHVPIFFLMCWMFLDSSSLWFVTLLNTLYCVKISNFQHSVFLLLKQNLSPKIPGLLLACVLMSAFTSLLYVVFRQTSPTPGPVVGKNGTELDLKEDIFFLLTSYVLSSSLQFIVNVTSASLLIHSLRRHIQKMQRNASGFWNPQTEAHVGAMKLMISFLVLYIPYSAATLFLYLPSSGSMPMVAKLICVIISKLYHPGHSLLIILTHPKLKTKAKQILCFKK